MRGELCMDPGEIEDGGDLPNAMIIRNDVIGTE